MGGLGAGRDGRVEARAGNGGAIADGEDVRVAGRPQRRVGHELIGAIDLEPIEIGEDFRPFDARRPDRELGGDEFAVRQRYAVRAHRGDARAGAHIDAHFGQDRKGRNRDPLGQPRQNPVRPLDQDDADVSVRIDLVEAVGHHLARALIELGGEFGAGRAGADDRDVQLAGVDRLALRLSSRARR